MRTIKTRTSITIDAAPKEVFKYLSNTKYSYYLNPSIRTLSYEGPLSLGATYDTETVALKNIKIKCHNEVTKFIPNKELAIQNKMGNVQYESSVSLKPKDSKTDVICVVEIQTESKIFGLTHSVLEQLAKKELQSDLESLKIVVENKVEV